MHSHLNAAELDQLIEQCQNGQVLITDLDPLLVYELELRVNERLAENQEPLMFSFHELAYNGFVPDAHAVWIRDQSYVQLFGFMFFSIGFLLLFFLLFTGAGPFQLKNIASVLSLLVISIFTYVVLLLVSNKPEDELDKKHEENRV
ncbi:hypothetical protein ACVRXQ_06565 [Streptococcus panodentis]|uniref:Uncharacterized protein n=1 Tax=Streptococcus panodentis TaxID=1581472 RepID=A0ABS5AVH7_9STRE|nr:MULTISPECIES: hypothetical protein [Streptococcus]KXT83182.1 hypothetical protein STRDD11_01644 [Streptococcus sp. DD11]MBP2620481.1 hypothetical protein [Streptococcus panodentis]